MQYYHTQRYDFYILIISITVSNIIGCSVAYLLFYILRFSSKRFHLIFHIYRRVSINVPFMKLNQVQLNNKRCYLFYMIFSAESSHVTPLTLNVNISSNAVSKCESKVMISSKLIFYLNFDLTHKFQHLLCCEPLNLNVNIYV